jgi:hypothetical protein
MRWLRPLMTIGALLLAAAAVQAQTTGNSNTGQLLFTTTLSPPCESCHSTTNDADARSLKSIRDKITARATPAGGGGTMSFAKALEALNQALTGTSLGGVVTGMNGFYTLDMTQRADLAAFISGLAGPMPILRYAPSSGPIFPATAAGATATATVTITNVGTGDLVIATNDAVTMATGGDVADFRITASTCPGVTLPPDTGNCTISVTFQPTEGTSLTRTASIGVATTTGTSLVPLAGSVVAPAATTPPTSAANPPSVGGGGALGLGVASCLLAAAAAGRSRSSSRRTNQGCSGCNSIDNATGRSAFEATHHA